MADQLSRNTTISTKWAITQEIFQEILELEPRLQVDLFATSFNHKFTTFVSPFPDQTAAAVDALLIEWNKLEYTYLFYKNPLNLRTLQKLVVKCQDNDFLESRRKYTSLVLSSKKSKLTQLQVLHIQLQYLVGNTLKLEKKTSKLRVWKFSK